MATITPDCSVYLPRRPALEAALDGHNPQRLEMSHLQPDVCHLSHSGMPSSENPPIKKTKRGPRGGVYDPFPMKVHRMLDQTKNEGLESIVSWLDHGRAFKIHKLKAFTESIMPRFFNQSKYTSFQRQLNLYGFSRATHGRDTGAYHHKLFIRGKLSLAKGLIRTKVKGNGQKTMKFLEKDPDFYAMPPIEEDNDILSHCCNHPTAPIQNPPPTVETIARTISIDSSSVTIATQNSSHQNLLSHSIPTKESSRSLSHGDDDFLNELNKSIFIHELAVGCTILCQLRRDKNLEKYTL